MTPLEYYAGEVMKFVLIGMFWLASVAFLIGYGIRHKKPKRPKTNEELIRDVMYHGPKRIKKEDSNKRYGCRPKKYDKDE